MKTGGPSSPVPTSSGPGDAHQFRSHGVRFSVETSQCSLPLGFLTSRMPGLEEDSSGERPDLVYRLEYSEDTAEEPASYVVREDGHPIAAASALGNVLDAWENVLQNAVAARSPEYVFVHAAVLGRNHRALLLPGFSYSGKSTLAVELARSGWEYYSDEFALLDREGCVHAYPRPAKLRDLAGHTHARIAASGLGHAGSLPPPLKPALIVFAEYKQGLDWNAIRLSPAEAMTSLLEHTVGVRLQSESAMHASATVARSAFAYRAIRGEAADAARKLAALMDTHVAG